MNKSKYFVFTVITTTIMLLFLGSWVTSVQATSAGVVDATPMPTIMPTGTPPGEFPSAEEQEELKAIVRSFIEIRYRALRYAEAFT